MMLSFSEMYLSINDYYSFNSDYLCHHCTQMHPSIFQL